MEKKTFINGMIATPDFFNELQDAVLSETQERAQANAVLLDALNNEIENRHTLNQELDDVVGTLKQADLALASTLVSLASTLDTKVAKSDITALQTTVNAISDTLSTETTSRKDADTALQTALQNISATISRPALLADGALTSTTGHLEGGSNITGTELSAATLALPTGKWIITATATVECPESAVYNVSIELGTVGSAPSFSAGECGTATVPMQSQNVHGAVTIATPPKIVAGGISISLWGKSSEGTLYVSGWSILAIPTV